MKFFADAMLGRLATWMRILGYDVAYRPAISDHELIERAIAEERTILTRDTRLIRRRKARRRHFFIEGDDYRDQLRQVVRRFPLPPDPRAFTRCLRCNSALTRVEKHAVRERVPPYVYETLDDFAACPSCGRLYWSATHVSEMIRQLSAMGLGNAVSHPER